MGIPGASALDPAPLRRPAIHQALALAEVLRNFRRRSAEAVISVATERFPGGRRLAVLALPLMTTHTSDASSDGGRTPTFATKRRQCSYPSLPGSGAPFEDVPRPRRHRHF